MKNVMIWVIGFAAACGHGSRGPMLVDDAAPDSGPLIIDALDVVDTPLPIACPVCGPNSPCVLGDGMQHTGIPGLVFAAGVNDANMNGTFEPDEIAPFPPNACGAGGTSPCDLFSVPMSGANMGVNTFFLLASLGSGLGGLNTGDPANEIIMGIELTTQAGEFDAPRTASFTTDPPAITSTLLLASPTGTTAYEAILYLGIIQGTNIVSLYMSTNGTIEINAATNGADLGSVIKGRVLQTNLSETDGVTFGPCTTTLESLDFGVTQGSATLQKPKAPDGSQISAEVFYGKIQSFRKRL